MSDIIYLNTGESPMGYFSKALDSLEDAIRLLTQASHSADMTHPEQGTPVFHGAAQQLSASAKNLSTAKKQLSQYQNIARKALNDFPEIDSSYNGYFDKDFDEKVFDGFIGAVMGGYVIGSTVVSGVRTVQDSFFMQVLNDSWDESYTKYKEGTREVFIDLLNIHFPGIPKEYLEKLDEDIAESIPIIGGIGKKADAIMDIMSGNADWDDFDTLLGVLGKLGISPLTKALDAVVTPDPVMEELLTTWQDEEALGSKALREGDYLDALYHYAIAETSGLTAIGYGVISEIPGEYASIIGSIFDDGVEVVEKIVDSNVEEVAKTNAEIAKYVVKGFDKAIGFLCDIGKKLM